MDSPKVEQLSMSEELINKMQEINDTNYKLKYRLLELLSRIDPNVADGLANETKSGESEPNGIMYRNEIQLKAMENTTSECHELLTQIERYV